MGFAVRSDGLLRRMLLTLPIVLASTEAGAQPRASWHGSAAGVVVSTGVSSTHLGLTFSRALVARTRVGTLLNATISGKIADLAEIACALPAAACDNRSITVLGAVGPAVYYSPFGVDSPLGGVSVAVDLRANVFRWGEGTLQEDDGTGGVRRLDPEGTLTLVPSIAFHLGAAVGERSRLELSLHRYLAPRRELNRASFGIVRTLRDRR